MEQQIQERHSYKKTFTFFAIIFLPLIIYPLIGLKFSLPLALLTSVVILWFSELIPLSATGLLIPVLAVTYGIFTAKDAFLSFGNQILFLFVGSFLLAIAMQKHRWDKRMGYFILASRFSGTSIKRLTLILSLLAWGLSMWISNTAACAIVTPMALGIIDSLSGHFENKQDKINFSTRILLLCAFASSIGGMASPVGSPPNLLAIEFLQDKGIHITFFEWLLFGLPISLIMLFFLNFILFIKFPVEEISLKNTQASFKQKLKELGKVKSEEIQVALCFFLAVILWVSPGLLKFIFPTSETVILINQQLSMGIVALLCSLILFTLPTSTGQMNLNWDDAKKIDWGTIILFGGGLTIGAILNKTGLAQALGEVIFSNNWSYLLVGAVSVFAGIIISEFSSNTASASILIPILLATFFTVDPNVTKMLVIATAFGTSFGFMLPVSTPPNAIVYGTGKLPLRNMIKTGIIFDISGWILITLFILIIFPILNLI